MAAKTQKQVWSVPSVHASCWWGAATRVSTGEASATSHFAATINASLISLFDHADRC